MLSWRITLMLIIRNSREFSEFENDLLLHHLSYRGIPNGYDGLMPILRSRCDDISSRWFGIKYDDTLFASEVEYDELDQDVDKETKEKWGAHERLFAVDNLTEEKMVELFGSKGIDFSDLYGKPLRLTACFCRQAIAAVEGILGARIDQEQAYGLKNFELNLQRDADAYSRNRKLGSSRR
jgi:hypothetical protein